MRSTFAPRSIVAIAVLFAVGTGCGSSFGGCGTLKPLPAGLTPFGVPNSQVIEGGVQARLTAPGLKKFSVVVENLLHSQLNTQLGCVIANNSFIDPRPITNTYLELCPDVKPACGMKACGGQVAFNSAQRPAPWNIDDGKDKADFSMADGTNPIMNVDLAFDLDVQAKVIYAATILGISPGVCTIDVYSEHWAGDVNTKNLHITAPIQLGIAPTTGKLTINALPLNVTSLGIKIGTNGCGTIISTIGSALSSFLSFFDSQIGNLLINLATTILQPQINAFIQGLLPDPLGLAGVVDTGALFKRFDAPPEAGLETYLVPGGYVAAKDRGLTLGLLAGMNSDANPMTRTMATASDPSLCVPARPVPKLGGAPWMLPAQPLRNDFTLNAAAAFAGSPDPLDPAGNVRDVTIGVSRTYFDLVGFHLYNSGSLCLHVDGSSVSQLSSGTLGLLVPSLGAIALQPKAPLQLVLRPQQPVVFTLGAGTAADALLHVAIGDLRIDMYTWIEERWVRFLTIGLDLNIGLNLTVTKDAMMNPVLQPMLTGIDTANLTVRVTNSELLAEMPTQLEAMLPALINIAASSLTGALPTVALPSVMGFAFDDLTVGRVQSNMDDFLGLFATLKTPTSTAPLINWADPQHPRLVGEVRTNVKIAKVLVPGQEQLRALFDVNATATPARPEVTLALSADEANGRTLEYAWKLDGGIWHLWTQNANPVIDDDVFLLQGHHTITVRARAVGDYKSEDSQPVTVDVLIDSVPPELHPHLDSKDAQRLVFGGWDLVTDADKLEYSYLDEKGELQKFTKTDSLTIDQIGRITNNGANKLIVSVRDEAGLIGTFPVDVKPYGHGSWGRPVASSGGCGCDLGGQPSANTTGGWIVVLGSLLFLARRRFGRRARGWRPFRDFRGMKALASLAIIGSAAVFLVGCGCDENKQQCIVDDDCAKLQCDNGKIPQCQQNMCICNPDLPRGDVGRYASMTIIESTAYVAAYNTTYGDLMIGSIQPPGRVTNWSYVDGIPEEGPGTLGSHVRGGVSTPGDDVGQFTSISRTPHGEPVIAYYDATNGALKYASFGAIRWHAHTVDKGSGQPEIKGDIIGQWASLSLDSMGRPGIAYSAIAHSNTASGKDEGQLRFAQATTADPQSAKDWTITVVDSRPLPVKAATDMTVDLQPNSIAIMPTLARKANDAPSIAYYDRERGNLRYAELSAGKWVTSILDGEDSAGKDTADVGQFPSMTFDTADIAHIAYVDGSHDNLLYVDTNEKTPMVIDDGYRPMDEMTSDGLPSPVFHLVGDSASIKIAQDQIVIAYQDSTSVDLRLAVRDAAGKWGNQRIAGHDAPYKGSYGFWANAQVGGRGVYVGSYGIDQQSTPARYFFDIFFVDLGLIQ